MDFKKTKSITHSVVQRDFEIEVAGQIVPCVIWTPDTNVVPRTLIAMGHGGSQHKKTQDIRNRAVRYANEFSWASLAIDAPDHGDRITREQAEAETQRTAARLRGDADAYPAMSPEQKNEYLDTLAAQAVPEWQAALDSVFHENLVADDRSVGYWGVSMGSWIGVPLLAAETRFKCAVLGLSQLHPDHSTYRAAAQKITIPLRFAVQWDDTVRQRPFGIDLFNAFGSQDKSLHINPGGHVDIPPAESESWAVFYGRHLD